MLNRLNHWYISGFFRLVCFIVLFLITSTPALAQTVNLRDFIAQEYFEEHSLSTGESVYYTNEGGTASLGVPVRQYKNSNWEQFFIGSDWVYRREDTSWAPLGPEPTPSGDATCTNGNKAIYTLDTAGCSYSEGDNPGSDGAGWAPATGTVVGPAGAWTQQSHTIMPIDTGISPGEYSYAINSRSDLRYCTFDQPGPAGTYPACGQGGGLQINGYFDVGEYTFCGGNKNPAPLVTIGGTGGGAGANDGFAYMEGCGLVGFQDETRRVGLVSGCNVDPPDPATVAANCTNGTMGNTAPITVNIRGKIRSSRKLPNPTGVGKTTSQGVYGAVITAFKGNTDRGIDGKCAGTLCNIAGIATTNGTGSFHLATTFDPIDNYEGSQYVAISCNGIPRDIYKIPVNVGDLHDVELTIDADKICTPNELPESVAYMILNKHLSCEENLRETAITALREQEPRGDLRKAQADDTYVGNDPDPDCVPSTSPPNAAGQPDGCAPVQGGGGDDWIPSEKAIDGRADLRAQLMNTTCNAAYTLWGLRCQPPPHNEQESLNNLPFASELKDCNKVTASTPASSGINTQTCGGPLLHLTSPYVWRSKYNNTPKTIKIAKNDEGICGGKEYLTLDDILVPEEWDPDDTGCAPFDYMDYKVIAFPGDPKKSDKDQNTTEVIDDAFDQPDDMYRDKAFIAEDKGDKPFRAKSYSVLTAGSPRGEYSRANDECAVSDASDLCNNQAYGGTPAGLFKSPDEVFGITADLKTNPYAAKPSLGRGIYRMGYPLQSACECNTPGGCNEASLNNNFDGKGGEGDTSGDGHLAVGGYKFCTPAVQQLAPALCSLFFGDEIEPFGEILKWAGYVVEAFFGIWLDNIVPGGECNPFDWGGVTGGNCNNPPTLVDGSIAECEITGCWYYSPTQEYTSCPDSNSYCATGTGPAGESVNCTRRYKDEPVDYQCVGDIEVSEARMRYFSPRTGGIFYSNAADNFAQYFYPVKAAIIDSNADASMLARTVDGLINRAYHYTNEAFWGENLGHDDRGGSGGAMYHYDNLRMFVSDPKAITDTDAPAPGTLPPVLGGGGPGASGGSCNPWNCFRDDVVDFQTSLDCAIDSLGGSNTWATVDAYGPYCDNETHQPMLPFAYNLFVNVIDRYAPAGAGRTCTEAPPNTQLAGTAGMACPAVSSPVRQPGHEAFDYYRGALVNCPLATMGWPAGLTQQDVRDAMAGATYLGFSWSQVDEAQIQAVLDASQAAGRNPFLIIGVWATESAWSLYQDCSTPGTPL